MEALNANICKAVEQRSKESGRYDVACGFADISEVISFDSEGFNPVCAISVVSALKPELVAQVKDGPSYEFCLEVEDNQEFLDSACDYIVEFIKEKGHNAVSLDKCNSDNTVFLNDGSQAGCIDLQDLGGESNNGSLDIYPGLAHSDHMIHKVIAAHAGLGWIGKNSLLVTKHFGPSVMIGTVLTDAPLECAREVFLSRCGRCRECLEYCPTESPRANDNGSFSSVHSDTDAEECLQKCQEICLEHFGQKAKVCGSCFYACPYTKSFLRRRGLPYT